MDRVAYETLIALKRERKVLASRIFTTDRGQPFYWLDKTFKEAVAQAGIQDFRFHDLRHTFAPRLRMAGVDLQAVKELMGHKTIAMTLRYATCRRPICGRRRRGYARGIIWGKLAPLLAPGLLTPGKLM